VFVDHLLRFFKELLRQEKSDMTPEVSKVIAAHWSGETLRMSQQLLTKLEYYMLRF
jgi:hypothetical protein